MGMHCFGKRTSQENSFSSEPCWYNCKYWNKLMLLSRQNCHAWYNHKRKYPLIHAWNTNTTLILPKAGQGRHKQRQEIYFGNALSTGKPICEILCTFGVKTGFWLAYLCQLQFFHLLPGTGSVFPMLKAIDLQHQAPMVVGMQGDPEHWFCWSTHTGEMKNPRQDKEIPLLHEMQLYSY